MCIWGAQAAGLLSSAACRRLAWRGTECCSRILEELFGRLPKKDRLAARAPRKKNSRLIFCLYETRSDAEFTSMTRFDLRQQDCIAGMSRLANESIDLVVTSPPYNLGIRYRKYSDRQDRKSYLRWCGEWAAQVRRVLKSNGSFFLNIGAAPSNPMLPHEIVMTLREFFVLQNTIHWIKSIAIDDRSFGHFKPINSQRFLNDCHEYVFHFTKFGGVEMDRLALGVPYQDKSNISRWSHTRGEDLRCRGNTWFVPYVTIQSREKERPHPATFPVQLAEWCIKLHGPSPVRAMLDPFLGIGNSAVAAKRCGVDKFIGFEIDETYLAEAKRRITGGSGSRSRK
jgi:site-specific DNA-methyltransferase (adenine-specific)